MNDWETPTFIEVDMSAEIGGYGGEDPDRGEGPDPIPTFVESAQPARS
jgi:hypothetical protein